MFLKVFVLVTLLSSFSMAALTAAEQAAINARTAANNRQRDTNNAASKEIDAYGTAMSTWASKIAKMSNSTWTSLANGAGDLVRDARTGMANAMALTPEAEAANNAASSRMTAANLVEVQAAAQVAEAAKRKADGKFSEAWAASTDSLAAAGKELTAKASAEMAEARAAATNAAFEGFVRLGGLNYNFNRLNDTFKDLNNAMTYLERSMDRSVMAGYLQQKMARMLSSNNLCKAAASCDKNGNNNAKFNFNDLQDIFPNNNTSSKGMKGTKESGVK